MKCSVRNKKIFVIICPERGVSIMTVRKLSWKSRLFILIELISFFKYGLTSDTFFLYWTVLSFILIVIDFSGDEYNESSGNTNMSEQGRYSLQVGELFGKKNKGTDNLEFNNANRIFDITIFLLNLHYI